MARGHLRLLVQCKPHSRLTCAFRLIRAHCNGPDFLLYRNIRPTAFENGPRTASFSTATRSLWLEHASNAKKGDNPPYPARRPWTEDEVARLCELRDAGLSFRDIASHFGTRSAQSVAAKHNLVQAACIKDKPPTPWTSSEHSLLMQLRAKNWSWDDIAVKLGRSIKSCASRFDRQTGPETRKKSHKLWTSDEFATVRQMIAEKSTHAAIAAKLGRNLSCVANTVKRFRDRSILEQHSPSRPWTSEEVRKLQNALRKGEIQDLILPGRTAIGIAVKATKVKKEIGHDIPPFPGCHWKKEEERLLLRAAGEGQVSRLQLPGRSRAAIQRKLSLLVRKNKPNMDEQATARPAQRNRRWTDEEERLLLRAADDGQLKTLQLPGRTFSSLTRKLRHLKRATTDSAQQDTEVIKLRSA